MTTIITQNLRKSLIIINLDKKYHEKFFIFFTLGRFY